METYPSRFYNGGSAGLITVSNNVVLSSGSNADEYGSGLGGGGGASVSNAGIAGDDGGGISHTTSGGPLQGGSGSLPAAYGDGSGGGGGYYGGGGGSLSPGGGGSSYININTSNSIPTCFGYNSQLSSNNASITVYYLP